MQLRFLLLIYSFLVTGLLEAKSFSKFFYDYHERPDQSLENIIVEAQKYHFVFVSGFLNERAPFYWNDMINELKDHLEVDEDDIDVINPSSKNMTLENSPLIFQEISQIKTKKPLIIIAHSKGAVETFDMAWRHPAFIRDKVKGIYFIQGSFGGSYVADHLTLGNLDLGDLLNARQRLRIKIQFNIESILLQPNMHALSSLTRNFATQWQSNLLKEKNLLHDEINDRLFYITSFANGPANTSLYLKNPSLFLNAMYGQNDGLVLTKHQVIPGIGKRLAILNADHTDFVIPRPLSAHSGDFRTAFIRALIATQIST